MEERFKTDPRSEKVYREYVLPLVATILESEERGVLIDQDQVKIGVDYLDFEMQDSTDIAQAAVGYKINLGSNDQVGNQLYNMEGLKTPRGRR
jgi:DNA polymerase I-like protein with 3'-5' exonuclease and polymerase domains